MVNGIKRKDWNSFFKKKHCVYLGKEGKDLVFVGCLVGGEEDREGTEAQGGICTRPAMV